LRRQLVEAEQRHAEEIHKVTNDLNSEITRHASEAGRLADELNGRNATLRAVTAAFSDRSLWVRPKQPRDSWLFRLVHQQSLRRAKALIRQADRARDAGEWVQAAQNYWGALNLFPKNAPIWVQYGHALKASGHVVEAEAAYRRSLELDASVADTHLQLAQILKLQGRREEAVAAYLRTIFLDPTLSHGSQELMVL
jgi:tetratricopeptide (TPR) repeat protein